MQSAWSDTEGEGIASRYGIAEEDKLHLMMAAARALAQALLEGLLILAEPHSTWGQSYESCAQYA